MIPVTPKIALSEDEIEEHFIHASGPGGQNVNKTATAVQLRFDVAASSLPAAVRVRLLARRDRRLTSAGVLVVDARRCRTREGNRRDAVRRLVALIQGAIPEVPRRVPTRPPRRVVEQRLDAKRQRGQVKRARRLDPRLDG